MLEDFKMKDVGKKFKYEGLTDKQINVLNRFTQYKAATTAQKKMAEIIGETYMINDWIYYGFVDTGVRGNAHCSMGHALRYVHYAKNLKTGEIIKFGIKCISDFFQIDAAKLKLIQAGFFEINDMVNNIIEKFHNGYDFNFVENKLKSLNEKPQHYKEMLLLLENKLPLPYCYEKEINLIFTRENASIEFDEFLDKHPEYLSLVIMAKFLSSDVAFKMNHPILFEKMNSIINCLEKNKSLTEAQLKLLNKIILLDFDDLDEKINALNLLPRSCFQIRGNYNEYVVFKNIILQYNDWGLSEKQVSLINKLYDRNKKNIELFQSNKFKIAE